MNDKTAATDLATGELMPLATPFSLDLDTAAALGAKARGVEIVLLNKPADMEGLPEAIPVGLKRGEQPAAVDLSALFEPYRTFPRRKSGQAEAQTFEAFCDLVNRHRTPDSAIFADADWKKPSFTSVIDYHQAQNGGRAAFGKHRIHYAFPLSEEWQKWVEMDGQAMKQNDFAWFLEDRVPELSSPTEHEKVTLEQQFGTTIATPSQLMELSRGLQVHVDTRVKAVNTLQTGEGQIQWEESHNGADGKPLKVPGLFILSIAPFFMGDRIRIPVRLRYRPAAQQVTWFYQIYRPDQYITEHVRSTLAEARQKTELPAYEGKPEMTL